MYVASMCRRIHTASVMFRLLTVVLLTSFSKSTLGLKINRIQRSLLSNQRLQMASTASIGDIVPTGINCDVITSTDGTVCSVNEAQDFGSLLASSKKAVLFAVPVRDF